MLTLQLVVPPNVSRRLNKRFSLGHRDGFNGYFCEVLEKELWDIIYSLFSSGYRVDITPGEITKIMAKKHEQN